MAESWCGRDYNGRCGNVFLMIATVVSDYDKNN